MSTAKHTPGPWTAVNHSWCDTSISAPSTDKQNSVFNRMNRWVRRTLKLKEQP